MNLRREKSGSASWVELPALRSMDLFRLARRQVAPHDYAHEHHQRTGEARNERPGGIPAEADVLQGVDHRGPYEPGEEAQGVS
jgi:hypothetical protein